MQTEKFTYHAYRVGCQSANGEPALRLGFRALSESILTSSEKLGGTNSR